VTALRGWFDANHHAIVEERVRSGLYVRATQAEIDAARRRCPAAVPPLCREDRAGQATLTAAQRRARMERESGEQAERSETPMAQRGKSRINAEVGGGVRRRLMLFWRWWDSKLALRATLPPRRRALRDAAAEWLS